MLLSLRISTAFLVIIFFIKEYTIIIFFQILQRWGDTLDIYIKPVKKATLAEVDKIIIKDVAEIIATTDVRKKVEQMKLMDVAIEGKKANFLISVTDIIKLIKKKYPEYTVNNVGAQDTVVQYASQKSDDAAWFKWLKIFFVVLILLSGSSTAIMCFHSDSQIPKVFENYYRIFFGEQTNNPLIISIPYAIGLAMGILVFFNHFMGKKVTDDPTPIEVEMALYETEINETVIDVLNTKNASMKKGKQNGNS